MRADRLTLLGVPIDSVGKAGGTELGPQVLRALLASEGLADDGDTVNRIRGFDRDPANGWLAFDDIVAVTSEVRGRVASLTAAGRVPLILGGCCTLLPGALAGARDSLGELGLAYVDGHLDLFTGVTSPTGEGADMPAATVLGMAPEAVLEALGPVPVVDPARLAFAGARDEEEMRLIAPLPDGLGIARNDTRGRLRHADLERIGRHIVGEVSGRDGRFWLHLDVDVLDRRAFPATDYLMDDGLSLPELRALITPLGAAEGLAGVTLTCFNPEKDRDGSCGQALVDLVRRTIIT